MAAENKNISFKTIAAFLQTGNKSSRIFSYAGLAIGVMLLLCCVQLYINIDQLLKEKNPRKNGYDFISVTKTITNENMGKDNRFSITEIEDFKKQSFIADAAPLLSNEFRVKMSAGDIIPFSTDLFLESIQNNFIDTLPSSFAWQPGQTTVPIIFSADFLEMYNVFAPAQGLPQISESSIGAVNIILECSAPDGTVIKFRGNIVAVSDRLNTVLVPESFLNWGNKMFGSQSEQPASRVYIKTTDANSVALQNYLQRNNYHVNKDKTKFGRIKSTLQAIVAGLGGLALLVVLLSVLLFSFYLQLMISRSKDNLQLLLTLGYSPLWLSKTVTKKWIPVYFIIIIVAVFLTQLLHWGFQYFIMPAREELSFFIDWIVIVIAVLLFILSIAINYRLVKKSLHKL